MVMQSAAGWRVIDKVGSPTTIDVPEAVDVAFGPGAAPADYTQVTSVYMKDGRIYGQTAEGPGPPASTPKAVTVDPSWRQGYRNGRKDSQRIAQGASPSYPQPWTAAWGYGTQISAACAGKTVAKMEMRLARTSSSHGTSKDVRPKLGTVTGSSAPSSTPSLSNQWTGPGLGWGESQWATLPTGVTADLASGTVHTLGASAGVSNSTYLIYTAGCGQIKISFSA